LPVPALTRRAGVQILPPINKQFRWYFVGALVLFAAFLVFLGYIWWLKTVDEAVSPNAKTALAASSPALEHTDDIRVDAWIDDNRVDDKGNIKFWINVQNPATHNLDDVTMTLRVPGFKVSSASWVLTPSKRCDQAVTVAAQGAITCEGSLAAGEAPGVFGLSAFVDWKSVGAPRRKPISVSPIIIEHPGIRRTTILVRALHAFFKDLGISMTLVGLAFMVKWVEEERERKRQAASARDAQVQQTWTVMLPKAHANAEKYYMPIASSALNFASLQKKGRGEADQALFYYLLFFTRIRRMINSIGGYYLKTREGEVILEAIWLAIRNHSNKVFQREDREAVTDRIATVMSYSTFKRKFGDDPEFAVLAQRFRSDFMYFSFDAALLELYNEIIYYEMNLSYDFWYRSRSPFPEEELRERLKRVEDTGVITGRKAESDGIVNAFQTYVTAARKTRSVQGLELDEDEPEN
jgi:hypothetical protein